MKGYGYLAPGAEVQSASGVHPLLGYGQAYIRRLTSAGPDTQSTYAQQLASLVGWLREIKRIEPTVENLTGDDDRDWIVARRRAGASPKTIANYHGLLYAICRQAVRDGLRSTNPCDGVRLPAQDDDIDDDEDKVSSPRTSSLFCLAASTTTWPTSSSSRSRPGCVGVS